MSDLNYDPGDPAPWLAAVTNLTQPPLGIPSPAVTEVQRLKAVVAGLRARVAELEAQLAAVQDYAAYYAQVTSQGDAPETFEDWCNGAANWPRQQPEAQP